MPVLALTASDIKSDFIEALIIPVCEDAEIHAHRTVQAAQRRAARFPEHTGEPDEELILYRPAGVAAERVFFMGVGKRADLTLERLRAAAGKAVNRCIGKKLQEVRIIAPSARKSGLPQAGILTALFEGARLANHIHDAYKGEKKKHPLSRIEIQVPPRLLGQMADLPNRVETACRSTILAREWINIPANDKPPATLARTVREEAETAGLSVTVLDETALTEGGFGALLAVGAGSVNPPRLVILDHHPEGAERTVALVGKGVTFDSGGLNLKTGDNLDNMKADMSGAAAVGATLIAAARLDLPIRVVGLLPLVENMPSGSAIRPGDIVRSYAKKTVEIGNTDAEGRLILIDALAYAVETYSPEIIIDMATLTGACVVALGEKMAGLFTPDEDLAKLLLAAGDRTHERCWRMPLLKDYKELLKSEFADLRNIGATRWGGAITAALFLSEFVGETRWAHIDIAGPAYFRKGSDYCGAGGTGFGVRLLHDLLETLAAG